MPNAQNPNASASPADTLKAVINTLNLVDVHGKANFDRMLSCILALENVYKDLTRKEDEAE